jgi:hypothetical protein
MASAKEPKHSLNEFVAFHNTLAAGPGRAWASASLLDCLNENQPKLHSHMVHSSILNKQIREYQQHGPLYL